MYFKFKEQFKSFGFNPHIHLILLVRKDYWNQKSKQWTHKKAQIEMRSIRVGLYSSCVDFSYANYAKWRGYIR